MAVTSPLARRFVRSPNFDARAGDAVDILVLHYTGMPDTQEALARLCDPAAKVSSHYLVLEDGEIVQLVAERDRAWHAGVSSWHGRTDINSRSIGIEIGNPGHDGGCPAFTDVQIAAVIALCRDIVQRWPIPPDQVLGHSDIAPLRKNDPGERFTWQRLHEAGVGLWVAPEPLEGPGSEVDETMRAEVLRDLAAYGYAVTPTDSDTVIRAVVTAFQRHFRPGRIDGVIDASTAATLRRLLHAKEAAAARR